MRTRDDGVIISGELPLLELVVAALAFPVSEADVEYAGLSWVVLVLLGSFDSVGRALAV